MACLSLLMFGLYLHHGSFEAVMGEVNHIPLAVLLIAP